jgi:hypothetical protein
MTTQREVFSCRKTRSLGSTHTRIVSSESCDDTLLLSELSSCIGANIGALAAGRSLLLCCFCCCLPRS